MCRRVPSGFQATCLLRSAWSDKFGKRELTKHFAPSKYGGEKGAREAAELQEKIWRDKYGIPDRHYKTFPLKNGTSGIPGISITSSFDKRRGKRYFYVKCSWVDNKRVKKRQRGTGYSITKYGLDGAMFRAIKRRLEGLHGKRFVDNLVNNSTLKEENMHTRLGQIAISVYNKRIASTR